MLYSELKRIFLLPALPQDSAAQIQVLVSETLLAAFSLFAVLHIGCLFLYKFE
jgi:hypothetical protein